jgi:hypothetical protein
MFTETDRFAPLPNGCTRLHVFIRLHFPLPRLVRKLMARRIMIDTHHYDQMLMNTAQLAGEQYLAVAGKD